MKVIAVVAGVIEDDCGQVLIARRHADSHAGGFWEFPGGKLEPGESAEQALRRELQEELGIEIHGVEPVASFSHRYPDRVIRLQAFRVLDYSGEVRACEGQPLQWVAVDALNTVGLLPADAPVVDALSRSADRISRSR